MAENAVWNPFPEMFDASNLPEWFQSVDFTSLILFTFGVTLFYLVMSMALRILSLLFWPTVVVIGFLFFRNETFAALVTESVKRISQAAISEIQAAQ